MTVKTMTPADWCRLILGLGLVFGLFQWVGSALGSDRGQAGIPIAAIVVVATLAVDVLLLGESPRRVVRHSGFALPARRGIVAAVTASVLLLLVIPAYAVVAGVQFAIYPDWWRLMPGLFAQAGVAEEALFRGYLFRHVREGRSFRDAAWIAAGPFVLVHLLLFVSLPWPIALASVALAAVLSFPLAYLFELDGNSIWAPALVHSVIQGAVKLAIPAEADSPFPIVWITASAIIPFVVFLNPRGA